MKETIRSIVIFLKTLFFTVALLVGVLFAVWAVKRAEATAPVKAQAEEPEQISVGDLVHLAAEKHGIHPMLLMAIVEKESAGQVDAIRYEPGQLTRAAKITKNAEQQRMYASSHGLAQVMGWWAPEFKLSWADLYEPETNLDVASDILKRCLKRHNEKGRFEQLHGALTCYNGSTKYADAVLQTLGQKLIERTL